jgi:hypothetical protein
MKYRDATILDPEDQTAGAGTKTIDINIQDPISQLDIVFSTTKSKEGMDSYPHRNITKIELVSGSDVLFSMNGGQAQALGIYHRKAPTMSHGQHMNANSEYDIYPIDFGRKLWDPMLAFDPKRFRNPQLKITYDEDVADTGVTANELAVYAKCFDEKSISPLGFLLSKNHWESLMGADGTYSYIDLPTDYPIRKLLIQGYYAGYEPWYQIEDARLSEDNLKKVVWDWNIEKYYRNMKGVWNEVREEFEGLVQTNTKYYYLTPTDYYAQLVISSLANLSFWPICYGRGGYFTITGTGDFYVRGVAYGYLPNHCVEFPFGDQDDIDDWYDVTAKGSVQLRLEAGSAGASGTGAVILQQLRRY